MQQYIKQLLVVGHHSGKDSSVFNIKAGSVETTFSIGDDKAVMIRWGKFFYTYSNLDTVFFQKGQQVKAGDVIGVCSRKSLDFVLSDTSDRYNDPEKYLDCRVVMVKK